MKRTICILAVFCMIFVSTLALQFCVTSASIRSGSHKIYRGLYIPNKYACSHDYIKAIITRGKPLGVNMLVLDAHPFMNHTVRINPDVIAYLKEQKIYTAARIVCFQDGLKKLPVSDEQLRILYDLIHKVADSGFDEVQLDYIRFPDGPPYYAITVKYDFIETLLRTARSITDAHKVILSADLFGRVVYNYDDIIGQKVERFARHADVIYPMLYPSHFTGDTYRISNPGETILEGTTKGIDRVKGTKVRVQPFIQCFPYNIQWAHVPLDKYVELQIVAAESTTARGWVAWNAKGEYDAAFKALENIRRASGEKLAELN